MSRLALALVPLTLVAAPALAQSGDPHAGHAPARSSPRVAAADPHAGHSAQPAVAPDPHAGHGAATPAQTDAHDGHGSQQGPAADPHAGHLTPGSSPPAAAADPHAGHRAQPVVAADPHAGHREGTTAPTASPDPHAGHGPQQSAPTDPHAGHAQTQSSPPVSADPHAAHRTQPTDASDPHAGHSAGAPAPTSAADPHAGHSAPAVDPHAGHGASGAAATPVLPTSADNPGRPPEAPPPPAAFSGPEHAADLFFDPAVQAAAREQMRKEHGDVRASVFIVDRLEAAFGKEDETYEWDLQGWTGGDLNRFWWKSEGEGLFGDEPEEGEVQALYSRAVSPFWNAQAGVRQDFRSEGADTTHLVLGVQGLAPYWWEVDAAAFLSTDGDLTARVEAEYDQRITQRLILQPRVEVELSAQDVPELEIGSGLGAVEAGLRLRYEIRKEFAPYVGVEWSRAFGETREFAVAHGEDAEETRFIVGLKAWF